MNISKVFTIAFSETKSIVNHNSQLAGQYKSAQRWTNWQNKITRTISLQKNSKDTKDNGISPCIRQAITRLCDFDQIFELQSLSKTVFIESQVRKLQNQFLQRNTMMALFFKRFMVGHVRLELVGLIIFFEVTSFLLQLVSFTVVGDPL